MKPTAMFVNVARGEVVDESGLARALAERRIAGARSTSGRASLRQSGPLEAMDNVILTPHIGAFTDEGQLRVVASVCRDVIAVLAGGKAAQLRQFSPSRRPRRHANHEHDGCI